jgi:hypothetical protein
MRRKFFTHREKIRLGDLRGVRSELCVVYKACVAGEIGWDVGRDAAAILSKIAAMDQGTGYEQRIAEVHALLAALDERLKAATGVSVSSAETNGRAARGLLS